MRADLCGTTAAATAAIAGNPIVKLCTRLTLWAALLLFAVLLPVAMMGPNTLLALYACAALAIGLGLLWRPQEPPILLFLFLFRRLFLSCRLAAVPAPTATGDRGGKHRDNFPVRH